MKKAPIIILCMMAISALVVFACNKLSPEPENASSPEAKKTETIEVNRGKVSSTEAVEMTIEPVLDEIKITTSSSIASSTDAYSVHIPSEGVAIQGDEFFLAQNSQAWWVVPFDDSKEPIHIIAGGSGGANVNMTCFCESNSCSDGCEKAKDLCVKCVRKTNGCCTNCDGYVRVRNIIESPWADLPLGSYQLINSNKVRFNGVLYTAPL